jgi:hypothetical protein
VDLCSIVKFIKKNPIRCNNVSNFIIPYLYEAQDVLGDTPPIIRSLKLHWQPLTTSTIYTSNNLPRMKNQRLPVQF